MVLIQLTGLPGAGKTTISRRVCEKLEEQGFCVAVLDGDELRKTVNKDLGFSIADRKENIRRLGKMAVANFSEMNVVLIAAINPYEEIRRELAEHYGAKTVWINCALATLIARDPKGLYKRALLPDDHPQKIFNLTGVNDKYEEPIDPDLTIDTGKQSIESASNLLTEFILRSLH